jgi:hypothetical protein
VFAYMCVMRAHQLTADRPAWTPGRIYTATVLTSCVPFALLYAIPPILVAVTAAMCLPFVHALGRWIAREHNEISQGVHPLPRAVVRRPGA